MYQLIYGCVLQSTHLPKCKENDSFNTQKLGQGVVGRQLFSKSMEKLEQCVYSEIDGDVEYDGEEVCEWWSIHSSQFQETEEEGEEGSDDDELRSECCEDLQC